MIEVSKKQFATALDKFGYLDGTLEARIGDKNIIDKHRHAVYQDEKGFVDAEVHHTVGDEPSYYLSIIHVDPPIE